MGKTINRKNITLLLTACINPNGMSYTVLQDPNERKIQYEEALNYYLTKTKCKIVFVENTGTYIGDKFQEAIDSNRLEFITFNGNNYSRSLGKGHGEALIIEKAFSKSLFLKESAIVAKITGRLKIMNIQKLLQEATFKSQSTVFGIYEWNENYIKSNFFIAPTSFYKEYFLNMKDQINDSKHVWFEHVLYQAVNKWLYAGQNFHWFYHLVEINGISGTTGLSYTQHDVLLHTKNLIKALCVNCLCKCHLQKIHIKAIPKLLWTKFYTKQS